MYDQASNSQSDQYRIQHPIDHATHSMRVETVDSLLPLHDPHRSTRKHILDHYLPASAREREVCKATAASKEV